MTSHLSDCEVQVGGTLLDALRALDRGGVEIAIVVDPERRLVGTLTDGDVRRALLQGCALDNPLAPHATRECTTVSTAAGRAEVLDLMQARTIAQVPIVDSGGRFVGLHLLRDMVGCAARPNWAVIMAGGRGARLGGLTDNLPKPMLRVAGRPILERIVLHLVGHGVRRVFLGIGYLGHLIEQHFGDGRAFGCAIEYLREAKPLGTGGALALLPTPPSDAVVVMNGDLVTQADVGAMLEFHRKHGQVATIGVRRYVHSIPFGCLRLDRDQVVAIDEKPAVSRVINAGIYVLESAVVRQVLPDTRTDLPALLEGCLQRGEVVRAFEIEGDWIDVGRHDHLREARGDDE